MHNRTKLAWLTVLTLIFIGRLVLGLNLIQNQEVAIMPDSGSYLEVAGYWDEYGLFQSSGTDADLMRTPGYPLLLWMIMQLPVDLITTTVVLQLFMGGLIAWLVYLILRQHFTEPTALLAAALVLLSPNLFLWSLTILTDVPFALLLMLSVYAFLHLTQTPTLKMALWSGLALGAATLVRPIGQPLIPAWCLMIFLYRGLDPAWKTRAKLAAATLLGALLFVTPWVARNALVWDQTTLSPISTYNLGHYQAAGAVARAEGISLEEARTRFTITRPPVAGDSSRYIKIILDHLDDYLVIHLRGTKTILIEANRPFFNLLLGERYRGSGVFSALSRLHFAEAADQIENMRANHNQFALFVLNGAAQIGLAVIYFLTLVGLIALLRRRDSDTGLLLAVIFVCFGLFILVPGPVGNDRFRIP
ncbi:MAG: glycosyltransferase family 39 protein, partial [Anaerolineales bacterium]